MKHHLTSGSDKNAIKTPLSKMRNGKVKKKKEKLNNVSSSTATSHGVQDIIKSIKTDPVRFGSGVPGVNPDKVSRRKVKLLKKKFGATLKSDSGPSNQQIKNKYKKDTDNNINRRSLARAKKTKRKLLTQKNDEKEENDEGVALPVTRYSDDPIPKKVNWTNRQRVLIFGCRGIASRDRHLMKDIRQLLPHCRPENKMERRENMDVVNEMCAMKHCNKCMLFEGRANRDVYMWLSNVPNGPSAKFLLQNIYTMDELRFSGNCLIGSRPLLSFDENFETAVHYALIKELLTQVFGTPNRHPKSQPFFDHIFTFSIVDRRIWFRNYQILSEDGALVEIGPRFIMNPIKIFHGSFGGNTLWENSSYVTPAKYRMQLKRAAGGKYLQKISKREEDEERPPIGISYKLPETDEVFTGNTWEKAKELVSNNAAVGSPFKTQKSPLKMKRKKGGEQKQQELVPGNQKEQKQQHRKLKEVKKGQRNKQELKKGNLKQQKQHRKLKQVKKGQRSKQPS